MPLNPTVSELPPFSVFNEVKQRIDSYREEHPEADLLPLSIGDISTPLPPFIASALSHASLGMSTEEGFCGYGPSNGIKALREAIAKRLYGDRITADEIFISDGAKCDIARLQLLISPQARILLQNPAYPAYLETSILFGRREVITLPCTAENGFFPDLSCAQEGDVLFLCSPNNPTGYAFTQQELEEIVCAARTQGFLIVYDAAYAPYIRDPQLPKTIYAIEGAKEVAIEVHSFSKLAGFTGIRLGWSIVPKQLAPARGGSTGSLHSGWMRLLNACYNGPSILSQAGGLAALEENGWMAVQQRIDETMQWTHRLREQLIADGWTVYGGENAPYIWLWGKGKKSWELFEEWLNRYKMVTTPGVGFGSAGEGFLRLSTLASPKVCSKVIERFN
ncbi:MAG: LL-diaminopimelate aminotransferase [Chlamydiia bacterium]|nr:LL-diaminopimelate aminotransferase [Chlamydiia bacterium]